MTEKKDKRYLSDNAQLMAEWNYEKNVDLNPSQLTLGSNKKAWWKCSEGHEWQATIVHRHMGTSCPYCSGRCAIKGKNDLQTVNPFLAKEWDHEKNNGLTPYDVLPNSNKKVWWKCESGHNWQATINDRNRGNGCPICRIEHNSSLPEYAIVYYLKRCNIDTIHTHKKYGYELDVYIPSKKIAIEYDGYFWHKDKTQKDLEKNAKCKKDGIKLYRIREGLPPLNDSSIDYTIQKNQKDFPEVLKKILREITKTNIDINLERDAIEIENLRKYTKKENSLLHLNINLANEWNYEKNLNLKPEHFLVSSGKKVWWKCKKGHEWQATIASRNRGNGCPYCSGKYTAIGEDDLKTLNPVLANEWNYEKNLNLKPNDFTTNSHKKVWWICKKGHEWQATIKDRNSGTNCPFCSGKFAIKGKNDLQTVNPTLSNEWNYEKNKGLAPSDVLPNSNKKVWWICQKGHEWQANIANRNKGKGCPYCTGRYIVIGEDDLKTLNPALANEWNYEKNNGLTPSDVLPNSNKKVWWKCNKGHEWQAIIQSRNKGVGCPECYKDRRKKQ